MNETMKQAIAIEEYLTYYGATAYCSNCSYNNHRYIKKGVRLDGLSCTCDKCGCSAEFRPQTKLFAGLT